MQRLCLLHETHLKIIYAKKECKIEKYYKDGQSQQILVCSYSFADIMTRDKYVALKIVSCSRSGNFL